MQRYQKGVHTTKGDSEKKPQYHTTEDAQGCNSIICWADMYKMYMRFNGTALQEAYLT